MNTLASRSNAAWPARLLAMPLLALVLVPVAALMLASSPADLLAGVSHPLFAPALWLSARTSLLSLAIVVLLGTPTAWWLAWRPGRPSPALEVLIDLPIVLPPAVVGIALLQTLGSAGLLGPPLASLGIQVPFTGSAVVIAQVVVSAPFFVQSAREAFRRIDPDLLIVARTLGASPWGAFRRVALPLALPGLISGAALAWARAIGEFGATLIFAGNLGGRTQTAPLAIYVALESDPRAAIALSLVLAGAAIALLLVLRVAPEAWLRRRTHAAMERHP